MGSLPVVNYYYTLPSSARNARRSCTTSDFSCSKMKLAAASLGRQASVWTRAWVKLAFFPFACFRVRCSARVEPGAINAGRAWILGGGAVDGFEQCLMFQFSGVCASKGFSFYRSPVICEQMQP